MTPECTIHAPRNGMHQGIMIPWSQRHNAMNFMEGGGPARTRTWDQWIMRALKINNLLIMLEQGGFD